GRGAKRQRSEPNPVSNTGRKNSKVIQIDPTPTTKVAIASARRSLIILRSPRVIAGDSVNLIFLARAAPLSSFESGPAGIKGMTERIHFNRLEAARDESRTRDRNVLSRVDSRDGLVGSRGSTSCRSVHDCDHCHSHHD